MTDSRQPGTAIGMHHRVEWRINAYGIHGDVHCIAEPGTACRLECSQGCLEWPCGHDLVDSGGCLALDWLDPPDEHYDGAEAPLRDGLIELTWTADGYSWRYWMEVP
jgi:hypothetical protein